MNIFLDCIIYKGLQITLVVITDTSVMVPSYFIIIIFNSLLSICSLGASGSNDYQGPVSI